MSTKEISVSMTFESLGNGVWQLVAMRHRTRHKITLDANEGCFVLRSEGAAALYFESLKEAKAAAESAFLRDVQEFQRATPRLLA